MWLDNHPYVMFYIVGCVITFFLILFKIVFFYFIAWLVKGNVYRKNIRKLEPPNEESFADKAGVFVSVTLIEVAFSWINVVLIPLQIVMHLFKLVREALTAVPEEIKLLRFPLGNNPNMSREAVWAYLVALEMKTGFELNEGLIRYRLEELVGNNPSFNCATAINVLEGLKVVNPELMNRLQADFATGN